jgi:hypothetical protein
MFHNFPADKLSKTTTEAPNSALGAVFLVFLSAQNSLHCLN